MVRFSLFAAAVNRAQFVRPPDIEIVHPGVAILLGILDRQREETPATDFLRRDVRPIFSADGGCDFSGRSAGAPSAVEENAGVTNAESQGCQVDGLFAIQKRSNDPAAGHPEGFEHITPVEQEDGH